MRTAFAALLLILAHHLPARAMQSDDRGETAPYRSGEMIILKPEVSRPQYRVTGEKALRPERVSDDGEKTFLTWHPDQALPAVFAINAFGREEIVDGYMRDGVFTIDRVYKKLVFRIDRKVAKANRLAR